MPSPSVSTIPPRSGGFGAVAGAGLVDTGLGRGEPVTGRGAGASTVHRFPRASSVTSRPEVHDVRSSSVPIAPSGPIERTPIT